MTRFNRRVAESLEALGARGQRVVAAVSGGPDSTALVSALAALAREEIVEVAAAYANHALRGAESDADERFVRELCERLAVPLVCRRLPVSLKPDERTEGIEAAARRVRQEFFCEAAGELSAAVVATAHTADDQAETVLHRIVRGTGLAGLAGIPPSRELAPGVRLVRPLLRVTRAEVLEYLAAAGQDFREDRSNRDLAFTRNRVRHELLPYLAEHFNPQVAGAIARLASLAADAQAVIDLAVRRLRRRAVVKANARQVVLELAPLRRAPSFLLGELLRQLWSDQSWPLQEIGQAEWDHVAEVVAARREAWELPGGVRAERSRNRVILARSSPAPTGDERP